MPNIKIKDRTFEYCFEKQQLTYINENTIRTKERWYKGYIKSYIGKKRVNKITRTDIDKLQYSHRHLSEQSRADIVKILSRVFALAIDKEYLIHSPLKSKHKVKVNRLAQKRIVVRADEVHNRAKNVYKGTQEPFSRLIMAILIFHAFRKNEILKMKWNWFNFTTNTVCIPASIAKNNIAHTFNIHPVVLIELNAIKEYVFFIPTPDDFVLKLRNGKVMKSLSKPIRIFNENGVNLTAHAFRNLFASYLYNFLDVDEVKISKMLCHSDHKSLAQYLTADKVKISTEIHGVFQL